MAVDQFAVSAPDPMAEMYSFSAQVPSDGIQVVNANGQFENADVSISQGYAMNAFGGGASMEDPQQTVQAQINPELLAQVDMASMLPQSAPSFSGGILGDIMGAANGLADDISAAANTVNPTPQAQPVPDPAMEVQRTYTMSANTLG